MPYVEPVIAFQLPTLPPGQHVVSAQVQIYLEFPDNNHGVKVAYNADLDALGVGKYAPDAAQYQAKGHRIATAFFTAGQRSLTDCRSPVQV